MSPASASMIATGLAFLFAVAITACLWVHVGRILALQIYSARRFGFEIPLVGAQQIQWGDVLGAGLARLGIWLLRRGSAHAITVVWLFVIETVVDLAYGTLLGIRHHATDTAHDLTWVILNFYVPVLWVSTALVAWQLVTRRNQLLGGRDVESAGSTKRRVD